MNFSKLFLTISILLIFFSTRLSISQNLEILKSKFPGHNEVVLKDFQQYEISIEKNKIKVLNKTSFESQILLETGIHNNSETFSFSELVPLKEFEAQTICYDKGKERKINVSKYTDSNDSQSGVFYSDVKERKLTFSSLEIGAKKRYEYITEFLDPFLLHSHVFGNNLPVEESNLEIILDKDIEIGFKVFNDENNLVNFKQTEKKGKKIYTWSLKEIKPLSYEFNNPGYLYVVPHIIFYIKNYQLNSNKIELLGDANKLYNYYRNFIKNLNKEEDPALKEVTLNLVKDLKTNKEKIKSIYYWVKDNIKYVAFENGYEGFIPRNAKLVYERKFGDCKDMSSIISEMAKYAQIPNVNITWIGTRKIPYSYKDIATPAVDNHMIVTYKENDELIFLDATDRETKFGLPSSFIQNKEALIENKDTFFIKKVPIVEANENLFYNKISCKLNKTKIEGSGYLSLNGYSRTDFIYELGDRKNKERFETIKQLVIKGNNKFHLKNFKEKNLSNRDEKYEVTYDFEIDNYIINTGEELYLNLFLEKPLEKLILEKNRKSPLEFDHLIKQVREYEIEIPADKQIKFLPKEVSIDNNLIKFSTKYQISDNKIIFNLDIETKKLLIFKNEFSLWNETISKLKSFYNETLILTKK